MLWEYFNGNSDHTGIVFIVFINIEFICLLDRIVDFPISYRVLHTSLYYLWDGFCVYFVFAHQMIFLFYVMCCLPINMFVLLISWYFMFEHQKIFLFCVLCCTRLYICWIAFMRFLEERVFISWLFHLRSYIDFYWFCFEKVTVAERTLACLWSIVFLWDSPEKWTIAGYSVLVGWFSSDLTIVPWTGFSLILLTWSVLCLCLLTKIPHVSLF